MTNFTLEDMGLAYRKAKVDLYYSSNPSLLAIADYEERLYEHLNALLKRINDKEEEWVKAPNFIGDCTFATKSVSWPDDKKTKDTRDKDLIFSSPAEEWEHA